MKAYLVGIWRRRKDLHATRLKSHIEARRSPEFPWGGGRRLRNPTGDQRRAATNAAADV